MRPGIEYRLAGIYGSVGRVCVNGYTEGAVKACMKCNANDSHRPSFTSMSCLAGLLALMPALYGQILTVTPSPAAITIYPGQQNIPLQIAIGAPMAAPVTVTLVGLPSGITATPLTLSGSTTGALVLNASPSAGQEGFSSAALGIPTSWTTSVSVVAAAGAVESRSQIQLTISISNPAFAPASSAINLPIVNINTNGVAIVDKTTNVPGTITITSPDGQTSYLPNAADSDNTATFHLHGNSTLLMPKLPYHVKLITSVDLLNAMGLQCPYITDTKAKPACDKSKSYNLLANYDDKTLLRDWSASALANAIPIGAGYLNSPNNSPSPSGTATLMPWAPHSLFVELFVNGAYEGNYQLIEEVKVDSHRVNISELAQTDTSPTQVTGGYLMEIDQHQDEAFVFQTPQGVPIGLIDPDFTPAPEVPEQTSYIANYVDAAETALFSPNFTDPVRGWRAWFDEASAINFYIVNDVMGNVDGGDFYSSDYLYKDLNNPLIYMGPIWDFDISAGNVNYAPILDPTVPWMQTSASWYVQWLQDPGFRADLVTQWNSLRTNGVFSGWIASIAQQAGTLEQSQANNFSRWPMLGIQVWPNAEASGSYDSEVSYLTNWLTLRIAYLDSLFNPRPQTQTTLSATTSPTGQALTLSAQVSGGATPTGIVSFLNGGVVIATAPLGSDGAATVSLTNVPVGAGSLRAVYNGDTNNALSGSPIQSMPVASPSTGTITSVAPLPWDTAQPGEPEGFRATVIAVDNTSALPTGTLTFTVDSGVSKTAPLGSTGAATTYFGKLASGEHTITVTYSGDATHTGSASSPLRFRIDPVSPQSGVQPD